MEIKEVIEILRTYNHDDDREGKIAFEIAIEALERQIAKQVIISKDSVTKSYVIQTGVRSIKFLRDNMHSLKLVDNISNATLYESSEIAEQYLNMPFLKSKSNVKIIEVEVEYRITKEL